MILTAAQIHEGLRLCYDKHDLDHCESFTEELGMTYDAASAKLSALTTGELTTVDDWAAFAETIRISLMVRGVTFSERGTPIYDRSGDVWKDEQ